MTENIQQNIMAASGRFEKEKRYWLDKLSGNPATGGFGGGYGRSSPGETRNRFHISFPGPLYRELERITGGSEYGMFILLLTGLDFLLSAYTGKRDILIGVPVPEQETPDQGGGDNYINYINNLVVLRTRLSGHMNFRELLGRVKDTLRRAYEHMNYPYSQLEELLSLPGPLFECMAALKGLHAIDAVEARARACETFFLFEIINGTLELEIRYDPRRLDAGTVERLAGHYFRYFRVVTRDPGIPLAAISILSDGEKQSLLNDINATATHYPGENTLHRLFDRQCRETPHRVAVMGVGHAGAPTGAGHKGHCTYERLNRESDRVARDLGKKGVRPGAVVGVRAGRTVDMLIAMLGVLKAGAAYMPIAENYPPDRIKYMLADSGTQTLITADDLRHDKENGENGNGENGNREKGNHYLCPGTYACIIYTSGSTGQPRGVPLGHRGIINHVYAKIHQLELTGADRFCHNLSNGFVASIWQVFAPLFLGAPLAIYPGGLIGDPVRLLNRVNRDRVTVLELVPSLLNAYLRFADVDNGPIHFTALRVLVLTGEKVQPALVNEFYRHYSIPLVNAYGQSECSDDTLHYAIPRHTDHRFIPIGTPAINTRVFVLDRYRRLQPPGVAGQLAITGDGIAAGYLNRPQLTADKFIVSPERSPGRRFAPRLFLTGDIARLGPDGLIECLGRADNQVKVRGNRVEPGEIEICLLRHPTVKEAAVIARRDEDHDHYLCAYVVCADEGPESPGDAEKISGLRDYLASQLPPYMVPAVLLRLERLPLNPNGKIDRKALEAADARRVGVVEYVGPGTETEHLVVEAFEAITKQEQIGINHNFFDSGGDSLKAIALVSYINRKGYSLSLNDILERPVVKDLARCLVEGDDPGIQSFPGLDCIEGLNRDRNRNGGGPNIFIFHPLHGMVNQYKQLAVLLEPHYTVYGVQARGVRPGGTMQDAPGQMVRDYLEQILAVQGEGPYIFLGYCVGSFIAYEVARRLEQKGLKVKTLIFLNNNSEFQGHFLTMLRLIDRLPGFLKKKLGDLIDRRYRRRRAPVDPATSPVDKKGELQEIIRGLTDGLMPLGIIGAPIINIRALETDLPPNYLKHLARMTRGGVGLEETPGAHEILFESPYVEDLARVLNHCLEEQRQE